MPLQIGSKEEELFLGTTIASIGQYHYTTITVTAESITEQMTKDSTPIEKTNFATQVVSNYTEEFFKHH